VPEPSDLAPGLALGRDVRLGEGVALGCHVTIHDGTVVGDGCVIEDGAVLGKVPRLARSSSSAGQVDALRLGDRVTVCSGAVVFAGSRIGSDVILGDQSYVRERVAIGAHSVVGHGSTIENDVTLGERVRIMSHAYVTQGCLVEDDVFLAPGVMTTNDDTMARHGPEYDLRGVTFRRACRAGGGTVFTPGVEVGEEAYVAAGAVVTVDVPPRAVAMGVPARVVRQVPGEDLLEHWR
jgi:acetyltransferase-like isoleucine patch superfamily enzyme